MALITTPIKNCLNYLKNNMDEDTFNEIARHNFILRLIAGFIFGIIGAIIGIVFTIYFAVNNQGELIGMFIILIIVGLLVSALCGYFLFSKKRKK